MSLQNTLETLVTLTSKLYDIDRDGKANELIKEFQSILSGAPHQHFKLNNVENIYNFSIWLICKMAGIRVQSEVSVAGGDIDMVIESLKYVYVIEFKKNKNPEKALEQIDTNAYSIKWSAEGRKVFKIGIEIRSKTRNIARWIIKEQ